MTAGRLRRRLGGLVAIVIGVAGCGIEAEQSADRIDIPTIGAPDTEPLDGIDPEDPIGAGSLPGNDVTPTTTPPPTVAATMYYIDGGVLVPAAQVVAVRSLRGYLEQFAGGPPESMRARGIRSALFPGLISGVRLRHGDITVDFDSERWREVDSRDQQLLIGQLVLTLADVPRVGGDNWSLPHIERVRFTLDGVPLPVLRRDGTLTELDEYVTRADYDVLLTTRVPSSVPDDQ